MSSIDPKRLANAVTVIMNTTPAHYEHIALAVLTSDDLYRAKHPSASNQNNQCEDYGDDEPKLPVGCELLRWDDGNVEYRFKDRVWRWSPTLEDLPRYKAIIAHMEWKQRQASKAAVRKQIGPLTDDEISAIRGMIWEWNQPTAALQAQQKDAK